jgi:hypothetical protein
LLKGSALSSGRLVRISFTVFPFGFITMSHFFDILYKSFSFAHTAII